MYEPMRQMSGRLGWFRDEMDQLLGRYLPEVLGGASAEYPALNVWEDDDKFHAEAELPGFKNEDIEISVMGGTLTLRGERKPEAPAAGVWHRRERVFAPFTRVVELGRAVDPEKVQASFKNGVLTVTLPKAAAAKPRKIEVRSGERKE
jgi:HSP20 family protein